MPRKHRDIRTSLAKKGFEVNTQKDHVILTYRTMHGELTTVRTKLSHASSGHEVSDSLLGPMARQVGLSKADFLLLIDCPMDRSEFERNSDRLPE